MEQGSFGDPLHRREQRTSAMVFGGAFSVGVLVAIAFAGWWEISLVGAAALLGCMTVILWRCLPCFTGSMVPHATVGTHECVAVPVPPFQPVDVDAACVAEVAESHEALVLFDEEARLVWIPATREVAVELLALDCTVHCGTLPTQIAAALAPLVRANTDLGLASMVHAYGIVANDGRDLQMWIGASVSASIEGRNTLGDPQTERD